MEVLYPTPSEHLSRRTFLKGLIGHQLSEPLPIDQSPTDPTPISRRTVDFAIADKLLRAVAGPVVLLRKVPADTLSHTPTQDQIRYALSDAIDEQTLRKDYFTRIVYPADQSNPKAQKPDNPYSDLRIFITRRFIQQDMSMEKENGGSLFKSLANMNKEYPTVLNIVPIAGPLTSSFLTDYQKSQLPLLYYLMLNNEIKCDPVDWQIKMDAQIEYQQKLADLKKRQPTLSLAEYNQSQSALYKQFQNALNVQLITGESGLFIPYDRSINYEDIPQDDGTYKTIPMHYNYILVQLGQGTLEDKINGFTPLASDQSFPTPDQLAYDPSNPIYPIRGSFADTFLGTLRHELNHARGINVPPLHYLPHPIPDQITYRDMTDAYNRMRKSGDTDISRYNLSCWTARSGVVIS